MIFKQKINQLNYIYCFFVIFKYNDIYNLIIKIQVYKKLADY